MEKKRRTAWVVIGGLADHCGHKHATKAAALRCRKELRKFSPNYWEGALVRKFALRGEGTMENWRLA